MAQYVEVNGQVIEFPDGMAAGEIESAIKANIMSVKPAKPAAVEAGNALREIPRQLGLTARYGLEGLANTVQIFTEPVAGLMRMGGLNARPLGQIAASAADAIGLPSPQTANERVIGDATRLVAGAGGFAGGANAVSRGLTGVAQQAAQALAANPAQQLSAAAGGGLAGGSVREAGGTGMEQGAAALVGTVLGGLAPGAASSTASRVQSMVRKPDPMQLEGRISMALRESGVDWQAVPQAIKNQLVQDVRKATATGGDLNNDALRRLADFRLTGTTPTRGMLTLDPVQITREQNLAKIGASTADADLQGLARVQNQNNTALIGNLNNLGANRGDPLRAGETVTSSILGRQASLRGAEQSAWDAAKSSPGYRMPVSAGPLNQINQALGDEGLMPFMNPTISRYMEAFQTGQQPFTPQAYRNLQSMLAREVAKGGNEGAAASLAQRILRDADIAPAGFATAPGSVVTQGTAAGMRAADGAADDAISAVNQARRATRQAYQYEESSPLVRSVLSDGATSDPQRIAQRYVLGGTANEAAEVLQQVGPQNREVIKTAVLASLKEKALSGAPDEVGKFSQSAFNKALNQVGERKLSMLFTPEELTALRANARVASYMQVQPVGSAVNNSNSGALMLGQGYDWINAVASKVPFGKQVVIDPLRSIDVSLSQMQAQNIMPALVNRQPGSLLPGLMGPGVAMGGLLAAPSVDRP